MSVDPLFKGAKGNEYNLKDRARTSRYWSRRAGCTSGDGATPARASTTGRTRSGSCPLYLIPPRGDHPIGGHSWVPIDDENAGRGAPTIMRRVR